MERVTEVDVLSRAVSSALLGVASVLLVVSATSLGAFTDVELSAVNDPIDVCTADVDLLDETLSVIPLNVNLSLVTVHAVRFNSFEGDCLGNEPQVVVIGEDPPLTADQVLEVSERLPEISSVSVPQTVTLDASDSLRSLFDVLDLKRVTELRVAFFPT